MCEPKRTVLPTFYQSYAEKKVQYSLQNIMNEPQGKKTELNKQSSDRNSILDAAQNKDHNNADLNL